MSTTFSLARSTAEVSDALQLRLRAYRESGRKASGWHSASGRLSDALDADPAALTFICYRDGSARGALRASPLYSGEPLQEGTRRHFDCASLQGRVFCLDMLVVYGAALAGPLLRTAQSCLARRGVSHALLACPLPLLEQAMKAGFREAGAKTFSQELGQEIVPLLGSPARCEEERVAIVKDTEILRFQDLFYTVQFEPGEIVVLEGERSNSAYLLEEGEVEVLISRGGELRAVGSIGPGRLIGEVALMTNEPRIASIVAKTRTTCMAFDRSEFFGLLEEDPVRSVEMFKIFQRRLQEANRRG